MTARNHHYVPKCYLKNFAKDRKKPKLYVVDFTRKKDPTFHTSPRNIAAERDFNRLDLPNVAPNTLEDSYARFESEVTCALERTDKAGGFASEEDKILVLNLVALMAVRNPRTRQLIGGYEADVLKLVGELLVSTPETWAAHLNKMRREGLHDPEMDNVNYEQIRDFVKSDRYRIKIPRMRLIERELGMFNTVVQLILARKWLFLRAPESSPGYITSDHPAILMWSDSKIRGGFYPPGFAMAGTQLVVPLSKSLAMIGTLEGTDKRLDISENNVAAINGAVIAFAERQVYAQNEHFNYILRGEKLRRGSTLLQDPAIRDAKRERQRHRRSPPAV